MPASKSQLQRLTIINNCLASQQRYWTRGELMQKLEDADIFVSYRTFKGDLAALRNDSRLAFYAPIEYCHYRKVYYYVNPAYSIFNVQVTSELERTIALTRHLLKQCDDNHILKVVEPILKAVSKLSQSPRIDDEGAGPVVKFQPAAPGTRFFGQVAEAIRTTKVLLIQLGTFVNKNRQHILHPYLLREVNHDWFVIGYADKLKKLVSVRLASLNSIDEVNVPFFNEGREGIGGNADNDVLKYMLC